MDTISSESGPETTFMGVDRLKIPWWPSIIAEKCDGCNGEYDCLKFCPHRVFKPTEDSTGISVENRYNCVVFCRACSRLCPKDAILFPLKAEILKIIKQERAK